MGVNLKILSLTCLAGAVVACWSLTQEVAGSSPFTVMTNIFVTEFIETFRKNSIGFVFTVYAECVCA